MAGKMVILDTCIIIELQRGNKAIIDLVYNFNQKEIFVTPVVVAEFYRGARDKNELAKCRKLIAHFNILSINENVVATFSKLFDDFSLSHRPSVPDMLIAATAIHYDMSLFTLNKKDFDFISSLTLL